MRVMGESDIPRSTLIVGAAFWAVLVGLGAWTLKISSDTSSKVDVLTSQRQDDHDKIIDLSHRVDQNTDEINDHARQLAGLEASRR